MRRLRDWLACFAPAVPWLLTAFLIVAVLLILVSALRPKAHAQFGGVQQPMFGMISGVINCSAPCDFPVDAFCDYTNLVNLDTQNGGCGGWLNAYVVWVGTNLPAIIHQDPMDAYSAGWELALQTNGINWFSAYVTHFYENLRTIRYLDAFSERAVDDSFISGSFAGGTNYYPSPYLTNQLATVAWTNTYVGKGY